MGCGKRVVLARAGEGPGRARLVEGLARSEIEAFIERQPLDDDEKAALWLWAWAEQSLAAP